MEFYKFKPGQKITILQAPPIPLVTHYLKPKPVPAVLLRLCLGERLWRSLHEKLMRGTLN